MLLLTRDADMARLLQRAACYAMPYADIFVIMPLPLRATPWIFAALLMPLDTLRDGASALLMRALIA